MWQSLEYALLWVAFSIVVLLCLKIVADAFEFEDSDSDGQR
jgi:hypothetical protein